MSKKRTKTSYSKLVMDASFQQIILGSSCNIMNKKHHQRKGTRFLLVQSVELVTGLIRMVECSCDIFNRSHGLSFVGNQEKKDDDYS